MIIDFNKNKKYRIKPAAESDSRRLEREIARIEQKIESDGQDDETLTRLQSAKNRHQLVLCTNSPKQLKIYLNNKGYLSSFMV
ncbi:hypothetical protein LCGC14_1170800 [marine sediment metagenome]|uniref:Uncharacterized protein n=1 Tax=marine sediment metagenome TaxID=412755 RepID=A0A0F9MCV5_9ZZZZ